MFLLQILGIKAEILILVSSIISDLHKGFNADFCFFLLLVFYAGMV
jgi:hypothetical protein